MERQSYLVIIWILSLLSILSYNISIAEDFVADEDSEEEMYQPPYTEEERQLEYRRRGHTWPAQEFVPNTAGWNAIINRRIEQLQAIEDYQQKWDGWLNVMAVGLTLPNFTEFGWGLSYAPTVLTEELQQAIYSGLSEARPEGGLVEISGPNPPDFIDRQDLTEKVHSHLKPFLEAWSGIELVPSSAYGFRLYRNESRLWMHTDVVSTHVISCIYHIGSSDDSKPWPIIIEGYDGKTNEVVLKPGSLLFYESAKNMHGRPYAFHGSWYTSLFIHYYPKENWDVDERGLDSHYAVPETWIDQKKSSFPKAELRGTAWLEPECENFWCGLKDSIKWDSHVGFGEILTGDGELRQLFGRNNDEL